MRDRPQELPPRPAQASRELRARPRPRRAWLGKRQRLVPHGCWVVGGGDVGCRLTRRVLQREGVGSSQLRDRETSPGHVPSLFFPKPDLLHTPGLV